MTSRAAARCLALSLLIAAHAGPALAQSVRIALNIPMSGPFANIGELYLKSFQFAVDAVNARGGVLGGRKLEVIAFDNKNSPQEALLRLRSITDQRIPFVMQGGGSHIAVPLADAVAKHNERNPDNRLLYLNDPGDQELTNEKCSFWTFMFTPNAEIKMDALTTHIARQRDIRRVYLINQDYAFGHQVQRFARSMINRKRPDIEIVGDDLHPIGRVKDFSPYVAKIIASKADAVVTGNWGQDVTLLVKSAAAAGLRASFYTYYAFGPGAPTAMGKAAIDRVRVIWRWDWNMRNGRMRQLAHDYRSKYGLEYYAMPLTTALDMVVEAMQRTGGTDALPIALALEDMRISTPVGDVWMRAEDHQLFERLYISAMTAVDGREITYDLEGAGIGLRTEARLEVKDLLRPSRCRMERPPRLDR